VALATLILPITVMRSRLPPPKQARSLFDANAWKNVDFDVFSVGLFFTFVGLYLPFFYIPAYVSTRLNVGGDFGFYLVSVLNAASIFGRIVPGLLADKFGSLNLLTFATIASGIVAFGWCGVTDLAGVIVFCIFYGFLSGAVVSLPPTVVVGITPELGLVGTWMGMSFSLAGLGLLVGNPIAGVIFDESRDYWLGGQLFGACFTLFGGLLFLLVRILRDKKASSWKI
jgi:MFS family permease